MSFRLIGHDSAIQITLGGSANGAAPSWGSASVLTGYCKSISVDEQADMVDVTAIGDGLKKMRPRRISAKLKVEQMVLSGGRLGLGIVGQWIKVEMKVLSSLSTYDTFVGIISAVNLNVSDDAQSETIEVEVGGDGVTYSGTYS